MKIERTKVIKMACEIPYGEPFCFEGCEYIVVNLPTDAGTFGRKYTITPEGNREFSPKIEYFQNHEKLEVITNYWTARIDSTKTGDLIEIFDEKYEDLFAIVYRIGKDYVEFTFISGSLKGERGSRDISQLVRVFSDPKIVI